MTTSTTVPVQSIPLPSLDKLHSDFLAILPRIETHARIYYRHIKCPANREDFVSEVVALTWKWFLKLVERGKDVSRFVSRLATFAAKAVRAGRRIGESEPTKDVLSQRCQQRRGVVVHKLPTCGTLTGNPISEGLIDRSSMSVPDQVVIRQDFKAWHNSLPERDKLIVNQLMQGEQVADIARKHQLSRNRISRLRCEYQANWQKFIE